MFHETVYVMPMSLQWKGKLVRGRSLLGVKMLHMKFSNERLEETIKRMKKLYPSAHERLTDTSIKEFDEAVNSRNTGEDTDSLLKV